MNYQIECDICHEKCWLHGDEEADTGVVVLDDEDLSDACEHIQDGAEYTIIDSEPHFEEGE